MPVRPVPGQGDWVVLAARTIKEYFNKNFEYSDIRAGLVAAISLKVVEPVFESQTKTRLGSKDMWENGPSITKYVGDFVKKELDDYLHMHLETATLMLQKIQESEKERKAIAGVTKLARERAKKVSLNNKKLRDCRLHLNDSKNDELKEETSIFITEGNSASGSITTCRDVNTQAVFSLRGKPLNSYGLTKKVVYENGVGFLLNYNTHDVQVGTLSVPAMSYVQFDAADEELLMAEEETTQIAE